MSLWARKCFQASRGGALVVLLAHARTDTRWFHDWVYGNADEIRFVRGRLRFGDSRQSAPFPSLVAVFLPAHGRRGKRRSMLSLCDGINRIVDSNAPTAVSPCIGTAGLSSY